MRYVPKTVRRGLVMLAYITGGFLAFAVIMFGGRILFSTPSVSAASSILYPRFCLGGWDHAQNASGKASLSGDPSPSAFTLANSAYLASSVAAQLFCGYFTTPQKTHPPTHVIITFQWLVGDGTTASSSVATPQQTNLPVHNAAPIDNYDNSSSSQESLSSDSGYIIATSTGFTVLQASTTGSNTNQNPNSTSPTNNSTLNSSASSTEGGSNSTSGSTSGTDSSGSSSSPGTTSTGSASPGTSSGSTSGPTTPPVTPPSSETPVLPASTPSNSTAPSSYIERLIFATVEKAQAQTADPTKSNSPFLDISYSLDGVRWISIGTVGTDNWKDYTVAVPVSSWSDVNRLQIMVNPIPSLDTRPDIYLESMAVKIDYSRTMGEALSDATAAISDAMDGLLGLSDGSTDISTDNIAVNIPPPAPVVITYKSLKFSTDGQSVVSQGGNQVKAAVSADGSSINVTGTCTKDYFVAMLFRKENDYTNKPSSAITNDAEKCQAGKIAYNLSGLSPNLDDGTYYLVTAEEGEMGPWSSVSGVFPVTIVSTTTTKTVSR